MKLRCILIATATVLVASVQAIALPASAQTPSQDDEFWNLYQNLFSRAATPFERQVMARISREDILDFGHQFCPNARATGSLNEAMQELRQLQPPLYQSFVASASIAAIYAYCPEQVPVFGY